MSAAASEGPHVRASWGPGTRHLVRLGALAPVVVAAVLNTGYQSLLPVPTVSTGAPSAAPATLGAAVVAGIGHLLPVLVAASLTVGLWERIFAVARRRRFDPGVLLVAVVFTLLMHPEVPLTHVVLGLSFAMVFGRGVFGGEGKAFLEPALLASAVLIISFPTAMTDHPHWTQLAGHAGSRAIAQFHEVGPGGLAAAGIDWRGAFVGATQGMMGTTSALAALAGAAVLVLGGVASGRLMLAHVVGVAAASAIVALVAAEGHTMPWHWHLVLGSLAFGIVFLATDPSSSAATDAGRWIQGIVAGGLVVTIRVANPSHPDGVIPALLLGSMLAPLIDHAVVWVNVRRRQELRD